jgi:F-type H+-transporting ATPase subunit epsilon
LQNVVAKSLKLQIVTPARELFTGEVDEFTAPGEMGPFTILFNHAPIVSALVPGMFRYKIGGKPEWLVMGGGFLEFHENGGTVLASSAERVQDIDIARAEAAKERAEARIHETGSTAVDFVRARAARDRANARIAAHRDQQ